MVACTDVGSLTTRGPCSSRSRSRKPSSRLVARCRSTSSSSSRARRRSEAGTSGRSSPPTSGFCGRTPSFRPTARCGEGTSPRSPSAVAASSPLNSVSQARAGICTRGDTEGPSRTRFTRWPSSSRACTHATAASRLKGSTTTWPRRRTTNGAPSATFRSTRHVSSRSWERPRRSVKWATARSNGNGYDRRSRSTACGVAMRVQAARRSRRTRRARNSAAASSRTRTPTGSARLSSGISKRISRQA